MIAVFVPQADILFGEIALTVGASSVRDRRARGISSAHSRHHTARAAVLARVKRTVTHSSALVDDDARRGVLYAS